MEKITKQIVEDMEKGNLFWDTPWIKSGNFPRNAVSKKIYRGVNIIWLTTIANKKGFTSNLWMTYQQAKTAGGNIKTGAKGTEVIFFKPLTIKGQPDGLPLGRETDPAQVHNQSQDFVQGQKRLVKEEKEEGDFETKVIKYLRYFTVFNLDQTEGLENLRPKPVEEKPFNKNEEAERIIAQPGAKIVEENPNEAFFSPVLDYINLPPRNSFKTEESYYSTAFHELTQNAESRIMPNGPTFPLN